MEKKCSPLADTYTQFPFTVARGEGMQIYSDTGEKYLDLYGGHAVAILGHCPEPVVAALSQQARQLFFYSNLAPIREREEAAWQLLEFAGGAFEKVFFCNSGAEANENALKLAIRITGRSKIAAPVGAFHGRTTMCASATDNDGWHKDLNKWFGPVVKFRPNELEDLHLIDKETAAVILEPILSMAGAVVLEDSFLAAIKQRCDEVGALLIFDEIQTGLGRTGKPFVSGSCGVTPSIMTLAKGLGGGIPVAAMVLTGTVASQLKSGDLGTTFGGGPLAVACVRATVKTLAERNLAANAADIERYARESLQNCPGLERIQGRGCLLGFKFNRPATEVYQALLQQKILSGTSKDPQVLRLLPPLIVQREHIDQLRDALGRIG